MNGRTWILVAHRAGGRLFENPGPGKGLTLVQDIPHPEGRLRDQDINADRHGGSADTRGAGRHSYEASQTPTEHVAVQFAKQLAEILDSGRSQQRYAQLVLVAEPRFLGNLRAAMSPQTASLVSATIDKDLGSVEARDLPRFLGGTVRV
ncbi:MAG: host attachment protein [Pseudomonadota bacterium]|nr:MAG: host attachment protein [Pseudomonadota bacterium]